MQFILTTAALLATASATLSHRDVMYSYNSTCDPAKGPIAKVFNRCSYPVTIWSIQKQLGCPEGSGFVLEQGQFYHENMRDPEDGQTGQSIKISKYDTCGGHDLTQLEYFLEKKKPYDGNYLDMSFVNCETGDCPGWEDGFYLKSGNQDGMYPSAVDNEHCPIFHVDGPAAAAAVSYVKWDDRQTKFCDLKADMELYLCGAEAPDDNDTYKPAPSTSEAAPSSSHPTPTPTPSSTEESSTYEAPAYTPEPEVAAAEVTPAPVEPPKVIKTQVVYETVYVKNKRTPHVHGHARRHQQFHA